MSDDQSPILRVLLNLELTNGNDGRGGAFWASAKRRIEYEQYLGHVFQKRQPFEHPVRLRITRVLGPKQRLWDADSVLRGSAKELIDALVAVGWFHDDGPAWITEAVGVQDSGRRDAGPATIVEVFS